MLIENYGSRRQVSQPSCCSVTKFLLMASDGLIDGESVNSGTVNSGNCSTEFQYGLLNGGTVNSGKAWNI